MQRDKDILVFAWISNGSSLPGWKLFQKGVVRRRGKGWPVFRLQSLLLSFRFYLGNYCGAFDQPAKPKATISTISFAILRRRPFDPSEPRQKRAVNFANHYRTDGKLFLQRSNRGKKTRVGNNCKRG